MTGEAPFVRPLTPAKTTSRTEWTMVITLTYSVPPRSLSWVLYSIWTRLLVKASAKPLVPRAAMRPTVRA